MCFVMAAQVDSPLQYSPDPSHISLLYVSQDHQISPSPEFSFSSFHSLDLSAHITSSENSSLVTLSERNFPSYSPPPHPVYIPHSTLTVCSRLLINLFTHILSSLCHTSPQMHTQSAPSEQKSMYSPLYS